MSVSLEALAMAGVSYHGENIDLEEWERQYNDGPPPVHLLAEESLSKFRSLPIIHHPSSCPCSFLGGFNNTRCNTTMYRQRQPANPRLAEGNKVKGNNLMRSMGSSMMRLIRRLIKVLKTAMRRRN